MGTICAPSYPNLYSWGWERYLFFREDLQGSLNKVLIWRRFFDDVLMLWTGSLDELHVFMEIAKFNNFNLKVTMTCYQ